MRKWIDLLEKVLVEYDDFDEFNEWKPPRDLKEPRPEDWVMFRKVREHIRAYNGGGGFCHEVSEWIEHKYGWERESGTYLSPDKEVAIAGHYWNVLPDGSILDCTADQTGEGHDMRLLSPSDPEYGRYDEEWYEDWHPGHPDWNPTKSRRQSRDPNNYPGRIDYDQQDHLENERGSHWWATHPDQFEQYINQQIAYATTQGDVSMVRNWKRWLASVKKRHA